MTEREQFEAWARNNGLIYESHGLLSVSSSLELFWEAWQAALAQPAEVEPVASIYITPSGEREFDDWRHDLPVGVNLLYPRPPAKPAEGEPVAWCPAISYPDYEKQRVWANGSPRQEDVDYWTKNGCGITYAYHHPPARVPLTDGEINDLRQKHGVTSNGQGIKEWTQVADFARAVIAAYEAKNGIGGGK